MKAFKFIKSVILLPLDFVMCVFGLVSLAVLVLIADIDAKIDSMMWKRRAKKKENGGANGRI